MTGKAEWSKQTLTRIARGQRHMILLLGCFIPIKSLLAYYFLLTPNTIVRTILSCAFAGLSLVQCVAIARLASIIHRRLVGLFCLLSPIPLISLYLLFYLNQRATRILNASGISVGFFGARMPDLRKVKFRNDECAKCGKSASFAVLECPQCQLRFCERCAGRTTTGESFTTTCRRCKSKLNDLRVSVAGYSPPGEGEGS